jgi:hypothetical protein
MMPEQNLRLEVLRILATRTSQTPRELAHNVLLLTNTILTGAVPEVARIVGPAR